MTYKVRKALMYKTNSLLEICHRTYFEYAFTNKLNVRNANYVPGGIFSYKFDSCVVRFFVRK
jgi:hypothetical protein